MMARMKLNLVELDPRSFSTAHQPSRILLFGFDHHRFLQAEIVSLDTLFASFIGDHCLIQVSISFPISLSGNWLSSSALSE